MSTDNTIAVCPQCGATGKAGRFCEYCGTKIPMPIKKATKVEIKGSVPWISVCPQGFIPSQSNVKGKPINGIFEYMVVVKKDTRQYIETSMENDYDSSFRKVGQHPKITTRYKDEYTYAIIDRFGRFVVAPSSGNITLFADNYDYINWCTLTNIHTGKIRDYLCDNKIAGDYIVYRKHSHDPCAIFNRKARTAIALDKEIPADYEYRKMDNDNQLIFTKKFLGRTLTCTVQINGNQGIVSIDKKGEQEAKEEKERGEREEKEKKRIREEKEKREEKGCYITLAILVLALIVGLIRSALSTSLYYPQSEVSTTTADKPLPPVVDKISLDLFFNKSKDKIGHLRQDVESNIKAIGFVKKQFKEDDINDIEESWNYEAEGAAKYIYYSSDKEPLISISINKYLDDTLNEDNKGDKIRKVEIQVENSEAEAQIREKLKKKLKGELSQYGFTENKGDDDGRHPSRPMFGYMRKGKEIKIASGIYDTFAAWDNIEFSYDKIELQSCDETKSTMAGGIGLPSGF